MNKETLEGLVLICVLSLVLTVGYLIGNYEGNQNVKDIWVKDCYGNVFYGQEDVKCYNVKTGEVLKENK